MKLSIVDRIIISNSLLPETGTIEQIKLNISIKNKIKLTEEESSMLSISIPSAGMLQINNVTDEMKNRAIDYELTEQEIKLLNEAALRQDVNGWVTPSSLDTIEMLINATQPESL